MRLLIPVLAVLSLSSAPVSAADATALSGTWRSAPEELGLSTPFDESVWGKNAKSVRTVEMTVKPNGDATLTVTRKVVDAKGRTVAGSTSIEHATLTIAAAAPPAQSAAIHSTAAPNTPAQSTPGQSSSVRSDLMVTVKDAERRYPDDPAGTWKLEGLKVGVSTFSDNRGSIEVRVEFPEGRGSFWETLSRPTGKPARAS